MKNERPKLFEIKGETHHITAIRKDLEKVGYIFDPLINNHIDICTHIISNIAETKHAKGELKKKDYLYLYSSDGTYFTWSSENFVKFSLPQDYPAALNFAKTMFDSPYWTELEENKVIAKKGEWILFESANEKFISTLNKDVMTIGRPYMLVDDLTSISGISLMQDDSERKNGYVSEAVLFYKMKFRKATSDEIYFNLCRIAKEKGYFKGVKVELQGTIYEITGDYHLANGHQFSCDVKEVGNTRRIPLFDYHTFKWLPIVANKWQPKRGDWIYHQGEDKDRFIIAKFDSICNDGIYYSALLAYHNINDRLYFNLAPVKKYGEYTSIKRLATNEEIEIALTAIAKEKGFIDGCSVQDKSGFIWDNHKHISFKYRVGSLQMWAERIDRETGRYSSADGYICIYNHYTNKFADIMQPKQPSEKICGYDIEYNLVNFCTNHIKVGCQQLELKEVEAIRDVINISRKMNISFLFNPGNSVEITSDIIMPTSIEEPLIEKIIKKLKY